MTLHYKSVISLALAKIRDSLRDADKYFMESQFYEGSEPEEICEYYVKKAFIQTLVLVETIGLSKTYEILSAFYDQAEKTGFTKSKMGIEDPYLVWGSILSDYIDAIAASNDIDLAASASVTKNLESILRESVYSITNKKIFSAPPSNETEVHERIEAVLRCVFQDLRHKPKLNKPIKNFEPDTGLPSIETLIEYKFISSDEQVKNVVDEILCDTRAYISKDWKTFVYVIYETERFRSESQWKELLQQCAVGNTQVIVISGERPKKRARKKRVIKKKSRP